MIKYTTGFSVYENGRIVRRFLALVYPFGAVSYNRYSLLGRILKFIGRGTKMQANLLGFQWKLGKGISLDDFFTHLKTKNGTETTFGSYERLLYVGETEGFYLGLFLTIKDQKRIPEIINEEGEYIVSVRSLDDGSNLLDFNFFIINQTSLKGLYQYYHHSCGINQFGLFCKRQYEDLRLATKEAELSAAGGEDAPKKIKKALAAKYKGEAMK